MSREIVRGDEPHAARPEVKRRTRSTGSFAFKREFNGQRHRHAHVVTPMKIPHHQEYSLAADMGLQDWAMTAAAALIVASIPWPASMPPCKYISNGSRSGASHESSSVEPETKAPPAMMTGSA